jgi:hypothetical protein
MKKIIIYIILCVFSLGLLSCGNDEPTNVNYDKECLYGIWQLTKIDVVNHKTGESINEELDYVDVNSKIVITPDVIYFFWLGNFNYYESGLFGWQLSNGQIFGTYMDYFGERWNNHIIGHSSYIFSIFVKRKDKISVNIQPKDDYGADTDYYRSYTFTKISNDYNY